MSHISGEAMSKSRNTMPFVLQYYEGGWRDLPHSMLGSKAAEFDTIEKGRELAKEVAEHYRYETRVIQLSSNETVAHYRRGGAQIS